MIGPNTEDPYGAKHILRDRSDRFAMPHFPPYILVSQGVEKH